MPYFMGIDIGSLSCDAVIVDAAGRICSSVVVPTGARNQEAIARAQREALAAADLATEAVQARVATGYGRERVEGRLAAVTEITCHARGIEALFPGTRVLIDIGGQDSKAVLLDGTGGVLDFGMNNKCAAGTGRFLEAMARALQIDLEDMSQLDRGAISDLTLSSMCTVFAESEVVSLIGQGTETCEIVAGLNRSIASRTLSLVKQVEANYAGLPIAMSGGVAHNGGVVRALEEMLGCSLTVPVEPDTVGALGAALIARDRVCAG